MKSYLNYFSRDIRGDILRESLKYVHEKGWSMEAIRAGLFSFTFIYVYIEQLLIQE